MISIDTIKRGTKNGAYLIYNLAKIIIPIYIIMTFLQHTPLLDYISELFTPIMTIFGLPGDAAIVLVFGNVINIAAAIAALTTLTLTTKQITIIAVMISFSHSLILETAVSKKIGVSVVMVVMIRITLAVISGILLNLILV